MTAMEIAAIAAATKSLAKELGVSIDLNQLASRVGLSRGAGLLGVLPMVGGIGVGVAVGVLLAPRSGRETRQRLSDAASRLLAQLREIRARALDTAESSQNASQDDRSVESTSYPQGKSEGDQRWTGAAE
jgi:gas vesicle protein